MAKGNYTLKVHQFKDGVLIKTYETTSELNKYGFDRRVIDKCVKGERTHHKGFQWKYEKVDFVPKEKVKKYSGITVKHKSEYTTWKGMLDRCYNTNHDGYYLYGGRGISICDRWRNSFENFLKDMGLKPSPKHSIDRYPNKDGNYEPGNCRWATAKEQSRNLRSNVILTANGVSKTLSEWAEELGCPNSTIMSRINKYGMSVEAALTNPVKKISADNDKADKIIELYGQGMNIKEIATTLNKNYFTVYDIIKRNKNGKK